MSATPWDPQPPVAEPEWKADVRQTLGVLMMMESVSDKLLADVIPAYDAQAAIFADVIAKQQWELLPLVSGPLVTLNTAKVKEQRVQGLINDYRNRVEAFALNAPFYDAHPNNQRPTFPAMPQELLDYLKSLSI